MKQILFFSAMMSLLLWGCGKPKETFPDNLLKPDSMVSILVDIHLAEAASNVKRFSDMQSYKGRDFYPAIFKAHQTDSATFRSTFDYYLKHPKQFEAIYDKVLNELSRRESESGKP